MSIDLERELGKFKNNSEQAELARLGIAWSEAWRKLHGSLPLVRAVSSEQREQKQRPSGLEPIQFKIEIPTVSEELYTKTREAVEGAGYDFIVPIRSVSMQDLIAEDEQRGSRRLGYVNDSKRMRAVVPPEMEVAINPAKFQIVGSNSLPTDEQTRRIKQEQTALRERIPEDIQYLINMEMVDPSTLLQLEDKYMDENNGALLLPNWFARTDVQTVQGNVAYVGRFAPSFRRLVDDWDRDDGFDLVFAASVVVLPRKLVA